MKTTISKTLRRASLAFAIMAALALFAAACGSSSDDDDSASTGQAATTTTAAAANQAPAATTTTAAPASPSGEILTYDELFETFQADIDRSHPFNGLDAFCTRHEAPAGTRLATSDGITEDTVSFVHIRSRLEQFVAIGFGVDVGDPKEMFEVFVDYVNTQCGGVNGRFITLQLIEVDVLGSGIDDLRNAACLEATEDHNAVFVLNSTGFQGSAGLCLAENSIFISTQGQTQEFIDTGAGGLLSLSPTLEQSLEYLADFLLDTGRLEGKTVGIVTPDTPGQAESAMSLRDRLEDAGVNVAVFDVIGCGGETTCTDGIPESVSRLMREGIDVLFPTLNIVSLPPYVAEMVTQGFEPGDIEFFNSDFNSQAGDLVTSKVVQFGGDSAGLLYNGATIVDDARTGAFREEGFEETAFNTMCADTYAETSGVRWDPFDADENSPYGMISTVCAEMRIALRALYDAGLNPTRDSLIVAAENLGKVDLNNMLPGSFSGGKYSAPDAVQTTTFSFPCSAEGTGTDQNTCVLSTNPRGWRFVN